MLTTFFAMVSAMVTIFGILLPTYHYGKTGFKDAEQKGYNPMLSAFLYAFLGFTAGLTIVSSFIGMVRYVGFPVKYYNCLFFYGDSSACMQMTNTSASDIQTFSPDLQTSDQTSDNGSLTNSSPGGQ